MIDHHLANMMFGPLLVFIRVGSLVMVLPFFATADVPPMVRIGLSVAITSIIAPGIGNSMPSLPSSVTVFALMIGLEIVIGLVLGWLTATILLSLPVAGQIISYQMGLSSVLLPNADIGPNSTLLATALNVALPALALGSGLFMIPVIAIMHSFQLIPLDSGTASLRLLKPGLLLHLAVRAIGGEFTVAVQLAAPFLLIGLVWQAGLALMAKASPQLQIFFAAAPLQLLGGMVLLAACVVPTITIWRETSSHLLLAYASW